MKNNLSHSTRVFFVCGTGGVGKTTLSALIAIHYATLGYKTLVMTVDPAKRLANALGLESLSHTPQQIQLRDLPKGSFLEALWLDVKNTFDDTLTEFSKSAHEKRKITQNRLYKILSTMMAGTHEYMAMKRLEGLCHSQLYDVIIVDTPPSHNSIDFFTAPARLIKFFNNSFLKSFIPKKSQSGLKARALSQVGQWFNTVTQKGVHALEVLTGKGFVTELAKMIALISELLPEIEESYKRIEQRLHDKNTQYWMIVTPTEESLHDIHDFAKHLKPLGGSLHHIIVNRVFPAVENQSPHPHNCLLKFYADLSQSQEKRVQILKRSYKNVTIIPAQSQNVYHTENLQLWAKSLFKNIS